MITSREKIHILPEKGNFYKAALHGHSVLSDGALTKEEIKAIYKRDGFQVISYTDHRVYSLSSRLNEPDFLVLGGYELDYLCTEGRCAVHLCAIAKEPGAVAQEPGYGELTEENLLKSVIALKENGFLVHLNHPVWSNMSMELMMLLSGWLDGIEVYNTLGARLEGYDGDLAYYAYFVRNRGRALPLMTDDCHENPALGGQPTEYGKAFTMIKAPELTYTAITGALANGYAYSSNGPLIHAFYICDGKLCLDCSPVSDVYAIDAALCCPPEHRRHAEGDEITHAEFDIQSFRRRSEYAWLRIRDAEGRFACLAPVYFDEYV